MKFLGKTTILFLAFAANASIDEQRDVYAITQGLGNKTANLILLKTPTEEASKSANYPITVPAFRGISSAAVQTFVKNSCGFDMAAEWKKVVGNSLPTAKNEQHKIIATQTFPKEFSLLATTFRETLGKAFDLCIDNVNEKDSVDDLFAVKGADELVISAKNSQARLMVRSSGQEDTEAVANAGGNETVANVTPDAQHVLKAAKTVVLSYFGERSLKQRLGAGDMSVFEEQAFSPLLIQEMVAAKEGELVTSGVMFTEEIEGGTFFRTGKSSGISIIQSAFGQGEGVVEGVIPVDTYYVDPSDFIYSVLSFKTSRMVPKEEGRLVQVKNDDSISEKSSLSQKELLALKVLAKTLEEFYGRPMDVEFVADQGGIHVVQARPIVKSLVTFEPSYLAEPDKIPKSQKIGGTPVVTSGASLRLAYGPSSVVIADTISEALRRYQHMEQKTVQTIVVSQMAPATSHEANTFQKEGKPVMLLLDPMKFKEWITSGKTVVIDPQQGLAVLWTGEEKTVDEIINAKKATRGFATYPVPLLLTIKNKTFAMEQFSDAIKKLLPQSVKLKEGNETADQLFKLISDAPPTSLTKSLQTIAHAQEEVAAIELARVMLWLNNSIEEELKSGLKIDATLSVLINSLRSSALEVANKISQNLKYSTKDDGYSKRLFHIHFFEAILKQEPVPGEVIDGYSIAILLEKILRPEAKAWREGFEKPLSIQLSKIGNLAFSDDIGTLWLEFAKEVSSFKEEEKKKFIDYVTGLASRGLLPFWLNTSFATNQKNADRKVNGWAEELAKKLMDEGKNDAPLEKTLNFIQRFLARVIPADFAVPKLFDDRWKRLKFWIEGTGDKSSFFSEYRNASDLGKYYAQKVMFNLVNTFDLAIKSVELSEAYTLEQQLQKVKVMLTEYQQLSRMWVKLVPKDALRYFGYLSLTAEDHLKLVDEVLDKKSLTKDDLSFSNGFDPQPLVLGSGVNVKYNTYDYYKMAMPKTLEDAFTLIHKNLLAILVGLTKGTALEHMQKPPLLSDVEKQLADLKDYWGSNKPRLVAAQVTPDTMTINYDFPLREHSMQYSLTYMKKERNVRAVFRYYGPNEQGRWDHVAQTFKLLHAIGLFADATTLREPASIEASVVISEGNEQETKFLVQIMNYLNAATFSKDWKDLENKLVLAIKSETERKKQPFTEIIANLSKSIDTFSNDGKLMVLTFLKESLTEGDFDSDDQLTAEFLQTIFKAKLQDEISLTAVKDAVDRGIIKKGMLKDLPEFLVSMCFSGEKAFNDIINAVKHLLIAIKKDNILTMDDAITTRIINLFVSYPLDHITSYKNEMLKMVRFLIDQEFVVADTEGLKTVLAAMPKLLEKTAELKEKNIQEGIREESFLIMTDLATKGLITKDDKELKGFIQLALRELEIRYALEFLEALLEQQIVTPKGAAFDHVVAALCTLESGKLFLDKHLERLGIDANFANYFLAAAKEDLAGKDHLKQERDLALIGYLLNKQILNSTSEAFKSFIKLLRDGIGEMDPFLLNASVQFFNRPTNEVDPRVDPELYHDITARLLKAYLEKYMSIDRSYLDNFTSYLEWMISCCLTIKENDSLLENIIKLACDISNTNLLVELAKKGHRERIQKIANEYAKSLYEDKSKFGKAVLIRLY